MATSKIKAPVVMRKESTFPTITETEPLLISDFFNSQNDILICAYYLTNYSQYAELSVRKSTTQTLIVENANANMSERPFYVVYM